MTRHWIRLHLPKSPGNLPGTLLAAATMSAAPPLVMGWYGSHDVTTGILIATTGFIMALALAPGGNDRVLLSVARKSCVAAALAATILTVHAVVYEWIAGQPRLPIFSAIGALVIEAGLGGSAVANDGELYTKAADGWVAIAASPEHLGLAGFLALLLSGTVLWVIYDRRQARLFLGIAMVVAACVLRYVWFVVSICAIEDLHTIARPWQTELATRPLAVVVPLLATGLAWGASLKGRGQDVRERASPATRVSKAPMPQLLCAISCVLIGVTWWVEAPGERKAGRVLFDDSLSESWAPCARRLDDRWFGDFATYGMNSIVEHVGYFFSCDVNVDQKLTQDLLSRYDVLVLKTPRRTPDFDEIAAINEWVERGGGLFIIGDHTNMMGSSTILNHFARPAGMEFRYDAVKDAASGNHCVVRRERILSHPIARGVGTMEFLTPCSISISGSAHAVLVANNQARQRHDYSQRSYFGTLESDPSTGHGPTIVCAAGRHGRGRVVAFGDSTVLASFAVFQYGRETLVRNAIEWLNRNDTQSEWWRRLAAWVSLIVSLLVMAYLGLRTSPFQFGTMLGLVAPLGVLMGILLAKDIRESQFVVPQPTVEPPQLAILLYGAEAAIPPALGGIGNLNPDWCYDTLYAAIPRAGLFPFIQTTVTPSPRSRAMLALNPSKRIARADVERLAAWVAAGGHVVVACRSDHLHASAVNDFTEIAGGVVHPIRSGLPDPDAVEGFDVIKVEGMSRLRVASPRIQLFSAQVGQGAVHLLVGTQHLTRQRLGHCFDVPGRERREDYDTLMEVLLRLPRPNGSQRRSYGILVKETEE